MFVTVSTSEVFGVWLLVVMIIPLTDIPEHMEKNVYGLPFSGSSLELKSN